MTDIMTKQALADAALELEQERVERALAWDRARVAVREAHAAFKKARQEAVQRIAVGTPSGLQHGAGVLMMEGLDLVAALDDLERLEGGL